MGKLKTYKIKEKSGKDIGNNLKVDHKGLIQPAKVDQAIESTSSQKFKKCISRIPILKSRLKKVQKDMNPKSTQKKEKDIKIPNSPVAQLEELIHQNQSTLLVFNADTNQVECVIAKEPEPENYTPFNNLIFKFNSLNISTDKEEIKKDRHLIKSFKARRSSYIKKFHRKLSKSLEKFQCTLNKRISEKNLKFSVSAFKEIMEENRLRYDKTPNSAISDVPDSAIGTISETIKTSWTLSTSNAETQTDSEWTITAEEINFIRQLPKPEIVDIFDDDLDHSLSSEASNYIPQTDNFDRLIIETPEEASTESLISEEELKDIAKRNCHKYEEIEQTKDVEQKEEDISKFESKRKVTFDASTLTGQLLKPTAPEFIPKSSLPSTSSSFVTQPSTSETGSYCTPISTSSTELEEKRAFTYSIEDEDKLLNIKTIISKLAFQNVPPCESKIRPDLIRKRASRVIRLQKNEESEESDSFVENGDVDSNFDFVEFQGTTNPEPQRHAVTIQSPNIIQTIDRLENMLEMLLMMGFNITKGTEDKFKPQEVPMCVHKAMIEVRGFLQPIKHKLKVAVQHGDGIFFQPFADCVNASINPAYHQVNDALVALESPITENYMQQSSPVMSINSYRDQNIISTLSDFAPFPKSTFMNQGMGKMYKGVPAMSMPPPMPMAIPPSGARVNPMGLIELPFHYDLRVVLTPNLGIMVFSRTGRVHIALSASEKEAGLHFRYGQVYQAKKYINFNCMDEMNQVSKIARITDEGIIFQDELSPVTYMTTPGGTITCPRIDNSILPNFISEIFYSGSRFGHEHVTDCVEILRHSRFDFEKDGSLSWIIQNIKIKQTPDGQLVVHKNNAAFTMVITPRAIQDQDQEDLTVSSRLTTPRIHVTSSLTMKDEGNIFHMYGKCQSRKVFYSNEKFVVRCQTQTAGIDDQHAICLHMT